MKTRLLFLVALLLALVGVYVFLTRTDRVHTPDRDIDAEVSRSPKARISQDDKVVHFLVPEGWRLVRESEGVPSSNLYSPTSAAAIDSGDLVTPPDIAVSILHNEAGVSLVEFAANYDNEWFSHYAEMRSVSIDDHNALVFNDNSAATPRSPVRAAFVSLGSWVVIVVGENGGDPAFDSVVASLELISTSENVRNQ